MRSFRVVNQSQQPGLLTLLCCKEIAQIVVHAGLWHGLGLMD